MVWLTDAWAPEGMRLYAVGDVHGCLEPLVEVHRAIEADLEARPVADWRVIHLGDYVDRGPDSRGVIDYLIGRSRGEPRMLFLRGNHDRMFERGIGGDRRTAQVWLTNGGVETLASYGIELVDFLEELRTTEAPVHDKVPREHRDFLEQLLHKAEFGDYYFVHAGIDPARSIDDQTEEAQLWIRAPFLSSDVELPAVVVHGHTPVQRVEVRGNRIGIDTGAVFGGKLSCLVLEDQSKALLVGRKIEPLPVAAGWNAAIDDAGAGRGVLSRVFGGRLFGRRG